MLSAVLNIAWVAFFIYIYRNTDLEDELEDQEMALKIRKGKQADILDRLIKNDISKNKAMNELNALDFPFF